MAHDLMGSGPTRRAFLGGLAGLAGAGIVSPFARAAKALAGPRSQAVISLGEPDSLFSGAARSAVAAWIYTFIANGLVKFRFPSMEVEKDLAESWTVSQDARTYTFTLRRDVRWHDGQPFTAQDVKFTFELWAHPEWPGPPGHGAGIIEGVREYKEGKASDITGIKLLGTHRVQFALTEPSEDFLAVTGRAILVPRHILKDVPPADVQKHPFARKPVYTGPFMVDSWRAGESLTFTVFPDHFAGRPRLDTIVGRIFPDVAAALAELRTGGILMRTVPSDNFDSFARDPAFRTFQIAGSTAFHIRFDLTNPLFSDRRVRQAMSHAIDRKSIIESVFRGRAEPSYSVASPLSWISNPNIPKVDFGPDRARALLDEAGWKTGGDGIRVKNARRLEFTINCTLGTKDWTIALQPFLQRAGVDMKVDVLEGGTYTQRLRVGAYEAALAGWVNFVNDPRDDLQRHFLSPRQFDSSGYRSDRVDRLFKQARRATVRAEEKKIYDEIQDVVARDAVYVHLWRPNDLLVTRSNFIVPEIKTLSELYASAPRWELRS